LLSPHSAIGDARYEYMILRMRARSLARHQMRALAADHYVIAPDDFFILLSPQIVINFYRSRYENLF
jgi:hypothetical protein